MKFTSFGHYVVERLGMSRRNAQALVALRRKFFDLPKVAAAFLAGEITRSQAEVIGRVADDTYEHEWIEYATRVSFVDLKRLVKVRRSIKDRSPGEFWDTCRRPPPLPVVEVQTCAPAEDGGAEGAPEQPATGQTCAPAESAPPGMDPGEESDAAAEKPAGVQVCAPAEGAPSEMGEGTDGHSEQPTRPQEVAQAPLGKRQAAAQEKAEVEKMMLDLMGSSERIPVRFFLPQEMEEAWSAFTWICDMTTDGRAKTADYLEVLADAFLMEHGLAAAQQMKDHPTQARHGWNCVIPTCSALHDFHEHHIRKRSQGGSDDPSNLANACMGHHQAGIHAGIINVTGTAPDRLVIQQGVSPDGRVHLTFVNGVLVQAPHGSA